MDLMALARFLLLPEDDLTLAELLKSPLVGFDDDGLFALAHGRRGHAVGGAGGVAGDPAVKAARAWLSEIAGRVDFQAPFELFAGVLAQPCPGDPVSGRRAHAGPAGAGGGRPARRAAVAGAGLRAAAAAVAAGLPALARAGDDRGQARAGAGRPRPGADHDRARRQGAAGADRDPARHRSACRAAGRAGEQILWPDEALPVPLWAPRAARPAPAIARRWSAPTGRRDQEYRRLLYVALTRAEDRLYICGHYATERGKPADGCWYHLVRDGLATLAECRDAWRSTDVERRGRCACTGRRPTGRLGPNRVAAAGRDRGRRRRTGLHRPPPPEPDPTAAADPVAAARPSRRRARRWRHRPRPASAAAR